MIAAANATSITLASAAETVVTIETSHQRFDMKMKCLN
jgi:hypothetical protein